MPPTSVPLIFALHRRTTSAQAIQAVLKKSFTIIIIVNMIIVGLVLVARQGHESREYDTLSSRAVGQYP
jgi:hypothetical protein